MTEVPELRLAVRASAERRYGRRRRSAWRVAPLLVAAAAVIAALVLLPRTADEEVPAVTPTPTATPAPTVADLVTSLKHDLAVYHRPQRPSDLTPALREKHIARELDFDRSDVRR